MVHMVEWKRLWEKGGARSRCSFKNSCLFGNGLTYRVSTVKSQNCYFFGGVEVGGGGGGGYVKTGQRRSRTRLFTK